MSNWHTIIYAETIKLFNSNTSQGLSDDEVIIRQQYLSKNELKETRVRSRLSILWN